MQDAVRAEGSLYWRDDTSSHREKKKKKYQEMQLSHDSWRTDRPAEFRTECKAAAGVSFPGGCSAAKTKRGRYPGERTHGSRCQWIGVLVTR